LDSELKSEKYFPHTDDVSQEALYRRTDITRQLDGNNKQQFPLRRVVKHNIMVKYVSDDLGSNLKKTGFQGKIDDWANMLGVTVPENKDTLSYIQMLMQEAMDKLKIIKDSLSHEKRLAIQITNKTTTSQSVSELIRKYEGATNCPESDTKRRLEIEKETRREENDRNRISKQSDTGKSSSGNNRGGGSNNNRGGYKGRNFNPNYNPGNNNNNSNNNGGNFYQAGPSNFQSSNQFSNFGGRGGYQGGSGGQKCHKCGEPWQHGHKCALNAGAPK
jgi:hypothetical protein